ncbi:MAG: RNA methyltransferase [Flavobacteriales bacterium]|nr:RNA methyltransferase [Flavobacteriales bacterium]
MEALSKQHIKYLRSLWLKKYRQKYGQFLVEGEKSVIELFHSPFRIERIYRQVGSTALKEVGQDTEVVDCPKIDMERISQLKTAPGLIALVQMPEMNAIAPSDSGWILALDRINDPGNLGTIIRIADWFGISQIWCSNDTVDLYNHKTLMACMGSFTRVAILYADLFELLSRSQLPRYYGLLEGEDVRNLTGALPGIVVIGNEANGISEKLLELTHKPVSIRGKGRAESLNAAVSAGILCHTLLNI